jgi:hypothetical protein
MLRARPQAKPGGKVATPNPPALAALAPEAPRIV